jgi:hypothetical protein
MHASLLEAVDPMTITENPSDRNAVRKVENLAKNWGGDFSRGGPVISICKLIKANFLDVSSAFEGFSSGAGRQGAGREGESRTRTGQKRAG